MSKTLVVQVPVPMNLTSKNLMFKTSIFWYSSPNLELRHSRKLPSNRNTKVTDYLHEKPSADRSHFSITGNPSFFFIEFLSDTLDMQRSQRSVSSGTPCTRAYFPCSLRVRKGGEHRQTFENKSRYLITKFSRPRSLLAPGFWVAIDRYEVAWSESRL